MPRPQPGEVVSSSGLASKRNAKTSAHSPAPKPKRKNQPTFFQKTGPNINFQTRPPTLSPRTAAAQPWNNAHTSPAERSFSR